MGKSTHFIGQPLYSQVIKLLDKKKILEISRKNGGERYIKRFDSWTHLVVMLYAVIMRFDSLREIAATNDSFMLKPTTLSKGDIMAMDRAYIDYEKLEEMTLKGVIYVTKMKKNLKYRVLNDTMYQTPNGLMEVRIQHVSFTKHLKEKESIHYSRIVTYVDEKKKKLIPLLTNDMDSDPSEIIDIYRMLKTEHTHPLRAVQSTHL